MLRNVSLALAVLVAPLLHAAPSPSQSIERWQAAAVLKYPALKQPGSPLNQAFLAVVAEKRKSDAAFFNQPDWPLRAADLAVEQMKAAETAAVEKAKAEVQAAKSMTRDQREKADLDRQRADEVAQWESQKDKWIFDRLILGDSEEVIVRKLNLSKLVAPRVAPSMRAELDSRYRWIVGERKFNVEFEMKEGLVAIVFNCLGEPREELETLIREDWDKLRAAAIERFGPPTKSSEFPTAKSLRRGGMTVTDVWERPTAPITLGVTDEGGKCNPTLRIGDRPPAG